jgi:peptidoglycan biosynthesis protein MviN/MurJ (putative lipid II flippase)
MKHQHLPLTIFVLTLTSVLLPQFSRAAGEIEDIDSNAEPLRTHFNAAAGKVRAIFLASPT